MRSYHHIIQPSDNDDIIQDNDGIIPDNDDIIPVDQPVRLVKCKGSIHGISHCLRNYCSEQPSSVICVQSNSGSAIQKLDGCQDARMRTIII
jgi:hypothetical protein